MTSVCNFSLNSINVQTLILNNVFEVGKSTYILAMWRAREDSLVIPIASPYPNFSSSSMWNFDREPQPRSGGEDTTNQQLLAGSGQMGRKEDDARHLEVWVRLLPLVRDLTVPAGNAVPLTPTP